MHHPAFLISCVEPLRGHSPHPIPQAGPCCMFHAASPFHKYASSRLWRLELPLGPFSPNNCAILTAGVPPAVAWKMRPRAAAPGSWPLPVLHSELSQRCGAHLMSVDRLLEWSSKKCCHLLCILSVPMSAESSEPGDARLPETMPLQHSCYSQSPS